MEKSSAGDYSSAKLKEIDVSAKKIVDRISNLQVSEPAPDKSCQINPSAMNKLMSGVDQIDEEQIKLAFSTQRNSLSFGSSSNPQQATAEIQQTAEQKRVEQRLVAVELGLPTYQPTRTSIKIDREKQSNSTGSSLTGAKKMTMKDINSLQQKFGVSKIEPKDINREMKRVIEKKNSESVYGKCKIPKKVVNEAMVGIQTWLPNENIMKFEEECIIVDTANPNATIVDNNKKYWEMHLELEKEIAIGIDIEQNTNFSHSGLVCLIQISSRKTNYLVDPFAIPNECKVNLKKLMENNDILKVLCDIKNDYMAFQRDFKINIWPIVDLQYANFILEKYECTANTNINCGLKDMASKYLKITLAKGPQLADYRIRPLSEMHQDVLKYTINDSQILIPIWNEIKRRLFLLGSSQTRATEDIFSKMRSVVQTTLCPPKMYPNWLEENVDGKKYASPILNKLTSKKSEEEFIKLHHLRFEVSKKADRPPAAIATNSCLILCAERGKTPKELQVAEPIKNPDLRCFRCPETGHTADKCPNKEKISRAEASRIYYAENPEKREKEKQRFYQKRRERRAAVAQSKQPQKMD